MYPGGAYSEFEIVRHSHSDKSLDVIRRKKPAGFTSPTVVFWKFATINRINQTKFKAPMRPYWNRNIALCTWKGLFWHR